MRYAAVGDSFSEGMGDEDEQEVPRGWADLAALALASSNAEPLDYLNLAIRGRLLAPIVDDQLDAALSARPDLITLNGGGNDIMRPGADVDALTSLIERAIIRCSDQGVMIVVVSGADPTAHLPGGKVIRRRGDLLSAAVSSLCERHAVRYIDNWSDRELARGIYWAPDRLHLNPLGHRRVAARVTEALGGSAPAEWWTRQPGGEARPGLLADLGYYREHVVPWVRRRLTGRSSGDGRAPKYGDWTRIAAVTPWPEPPPATRADPGRLRSPGADTP